MRIQDVMSQHVKTCVPEDTLDAAAHLMSVHDCGCVPVVDHTGQIVGMVTDRDICMAALANGRPLAALPVTSAMSKKVYWCKPEDTLATAENIMEVHQIRRLPVVVADGHLVGVLSLSDLAREALRQRVGKATADVTAHGISQTLAAICEPRSRASTAAAS